MVRRRPPCPQKKKKKEYLQSLKLNINLAIRVKKKYQECIAGAGMVMHTKGEKKSITSLGPKMLL